MRRLRDAAPRATLAQCPAVQRRVGRRDAAQFPRGGPRTARRTASRPRWPRPCILEQHGYPPLVLSFESIDQTGPRHLRLPASEGRWGSVARSRDPGLHGRKPVFSDPAGARPELRGSRTWTSLGASRATRWSTWRRQMGSYDWRLSDAQRVEGRADADRPPAPDHRHVATRGSTACARGTAATARVHGRKPVEYRGRERWIRTCPPPGQLRRRRPRAGRRGAAAPVNRGRSPVAGA